MPDRVSPTVLVASDDFVLLDEIVRHLEDIPKWKLVTSPGSVSQMIAAYEANSPDVVLLSDGLARDLAKSTAALGAVTLVVVGRQEQVASLKAALKLGARGFVLWPGQARQLQVLVERDAAGLSSRSTASGPLFAVWAAKGGSGASVIAAHLAACLSKVEHGCILVDADLDHADQSSILGVEEGTQNLSDLLRMGDELSPRIVESVAWKHPDGFKSILSPGILGESGLWKGQELSRLLASIRQSAGSVVVDLPSGLNEISETVVQGASATVVVATPDLLCLKRTREALRALRNSGVEESRFTLLLNQTNPSSVSKKEVSAILRLEPSAELKADLQIYQAANRGQLSALGKRTLTKLARRLLESNSPAAGRRKSLRGGGQ